MTTFEAIKKMTETQFAQFLDQVYLTGFNTGYQSLVDPSIYDGNPYNEDWLASEYEGSPDYVEDEDGEMLIIEPLLKVVTRIAEFDPNNIPDDICWGAQILLPKGINDEE